MGEKRRRFWRGLSIALALMMVLAACSGKSGDGGGSSSSGQQSGGGSSGASGASGGASCGDPFTISAFIGAPHQTPTPDNRIYKKIENELCVKLEMEFLVGDLQQKLGVMIAGGEYPDLITADTKLVAA